MASGASYLIHYTVFFRSEQVTDKQMFAGDEGLVSLQHARAQSLALGVNDACILLLQYIYHLFLHLSDRNHASGIRYAMTRIGASSEHQRSGGPIRLCST